MEEIIEFSAKLFKAFLSSYDQNELIRLYSEAKKLYGKVDTTAVENKDKNSITIPFEIEELRRIMERLRLELIRRGIDPQSISANVETQEETYESNNLMTIEKCDYVFDHYEGDYEVQVCRDCGAERRIPRSYGESKNIDNSVSNEGIMHEHTFKDEYDDGEYITQICTVCDEKRTIKASDYKFNQEESESKGMYL